MNKEKGKEDIRDFNGEPSYISVIHLGAHWTLVFLFSLLTFLVPRKVRDRQAVGTFISWFISLQNDQRRVKANYDLK